MKQTIAEKFGSMRSCAFGQITTELTARKIQRVVIIRSSGHECFRFWPSRVNMLKQVARQYGAQVIESGRTNATISFPRSVDERTAMSRTNQIIDDWCELLDNEHKESQGSKRKARRRTNGNAPNSPYNTPRDRADRRETLVNPGARS